MTVRRFRATIPPLVLQNLRTTNVTQTTIALAWDAYPGATAYQVRRNGTLISTPTGTTYSNSGHTAGTQYTYAVRPVVGGSGVASAESSIVVTTAGAVVAGAFYVATTGNDASGDGSIGNPWRTPAYGASRLTSQGGTLYIRGGTYDVATPTANRSCAIYPRANNCTISAYPGETITLRGGRGGTNFGVAPTGGVIGAMNGISGTIISGFNVIGMVMADSNASGTRRTRIENCDISVGGDGWPGTGQGAVVWWDDCVDVDLINCVLRDNAVGPESSVPGNNGLLMAYDNHNCTIERCTFLRSVGTGITMKDDVSNAAVRFNWFDSCAASALFTGNNTANAYPLSIDMTQNLITNNNTSNNPEHGGIVLVAQTSLVNVYNNTFHRNYNADVVQWLGGTPIPFTFFNNLCFQSRAHYLSWPYSVSAFGGQYINFNGYNGGVSGWRYRSAVNTTSLQTWQAYVSANLLSGAETNSNVTDPGFVNASGNWSQASDYRRAAYPANGRGGSYSSVQGAYITGNEIIGAVI